jgi:hypothetical protein
LAEENPHCRAESDGQDAGNQPEEGGHAGIDLLIHGIRMEGKLKSGKGVAGIPESDDCSMRQPAVVLRA